MKKYILPFLLVLISSIPIMGNLALGTVALGNQDPYTVACATGYVRGLPHYCNNSTAVIVGDVLTLDGTCRALSLTGLLTGYPSNTRFAAINIESTLRSLNSVGLVTWDLNVYADAGCTTSSFIVKNWAREFVAVVANTIFHVTTIPIIAPVVGTNVFYNGTTPSTTKTSGVTLIGYYD